MKKLTILVPFKNREDNLKVFVPYMVNYMKNYFPEIEYKIVVIEQLNDKPFNKGILFNAGFVITSGSTDYYALHDVDELPISSNYEYNEKPFHLCVNVYNQDNNGKLVNVYKDKFKHRGGCVLIDKNIYQKSNGHSNLYWGWGCIDINFSFRLEWIGYNFNRYTDINGQYLCHYFSLNANTKRFEDDPHYKYNDIIDNKTVSGKLNYKEEGLNNLNFDIKNKIEYENYIKYQIDFDNDDYIK